MDDVQQQVAELRERVRRLEALANAGDDAYDAAWRAAYNAGIREGCESVRRRIPTHGEDA